MMLLSSGGKTSKRDLSPCMFAPSEPLPDELSPIEPVLVALPLIDLGA